ncbi:BLUF domain-containing protein [Maribacter litoralis]|uniref:BLUF domain-containing protein n=1 Tax=Maribacter litoralis TaxID=2059726 RepID=UPI003F5CC785
MIFTLTYGSLASRKMCATELELLMATARSNNNKLGVTGCLIYFMGGFVQILEGEEVIIKGLYEKIKKESRHKNVYTFSNERCKKRT